MRSIMSVTSLLRSPKLLGSPPQRASSLLSLLLSRGQRMSDRENPTRSANYSRTEAASEAELTATRREHDCASIDDVKRERERYQEEEVTRSSRVSAADGIRNYPPSRHRKYRWRNGSLIPRPASCQYLSSTSFIFLLLFLSIRLSLS